jgi:hypothetical protein
VTSAPASNSAFTSAAVAVFHQSLSHNFPQSASACVAKVNISAISAARMAGTFQFHLLGVSGALGLERINLELSCHQASAGVFLYTDMKRTNNRTICRNFLFFIK